MHQHHHHEDPHGRHRWAYKSGEQPGECSCGYHQQYRPACGCGSSHGSTKHDLKKMVFTAYRQALMSRIEAEIATRRGKQLDETAKELVDIVEDKMKAKAEMHKRLSSLAEQVMGQFED